MNDMQIQEAEKSEQPFTADSGKRRISKNVMEKMEAAGTVKDLITSNRFMKISDDEVDMKT